MEQGIEEEAAPLALRVKAILPSVLAALGNDSELPPDTTRPRPDGSPLEMSHGRLVDRPELLCAIVGALGLVRDLRVLDNVLSRLRQDRARSAMTRCSCGAAPRCVRPGRRTLCRRDLPGPDGRGVAVLASAQRLARQDRHYTQIDSSWTLPGKKVRHEAIEVLGALDRHHV
jgi:hypothetical protein